MVKHKENIQHGRRNSRETQVCELTDTLIRGQILLSGKEVLLLSPERKMKYFLIIVATIIGYEIIRALFLGLIRKRLIRSTSRYIESNRIRLDRYKFMNRLMVKHELLNNPEVHQGIINHARDQGMPVQEVQEQVEEYIDEIVPFFNLLSYYKLGYWVANLFLNMIYEVVIDRENAEKLKGIPSDSIVVFIMNHRSNIDYILVAYMLARQISLSYAVGEWARVWPLEYIFKSFGAYFIRRKYREKLYHLVLEKYVQHISIQGITQGIFIEGGLSRNGRFRGVKIGILDYIIGIRKNPDFKRELVFVPASINYDWVLEDNILVREWKEGKKKKRGFGQNIISLTRLVVRTPVLLGINTLRLMTRRLKEHGTASVSFGDPVFLSELLKKEKEDIFSLERHERLSRVNHYAERLLDRIGEVMPVTPLCLSAHSALALEKKHFTRDELFARMARDAHYLKDQGCRLVRGRAFEASRRSYEKLNRERASRQKELVAFEENYLESEEARESLRFALELMRKRNMIRGPKNNLRIVEKNRLLLEYYANSLAHFFDRKEQT